MKNKIMLIVLLTTSTLWSSFNFGECSGSGTFEQEIIHYNNDNSNDILVGNIPQGIQGLKILLISDKDVDIRIFDSNNQQAIVAWSPKNTLSAILWKSTIDTQSYQNVPITYSGYNGVGGHKGHEFIKIDSSTPTAMKMKAFGYKSGFATVNYSWTSKEGCTPKTSGEGNFTQTLNKSVTSLVGTIPPNVNNLEIKLTSNKDLDIQLYGEDNTAIVSWKPKGLLSGSGKQNILYHDMNITWSGYNGVEGKKGNEYIKITGLSSEMFVMKVFGYEAGSADVTYTWGDANTTRLSKPTVLTASPTKTFNTSETIEISGDVGTNVFVNSQLVGQIGSSGVLTLTLDTSGNDGIKTFSIKVKDMAGNSSEALIIMIQKESDPKYQLSYKGLNFYYQNLESDSYGLAQLNDSTLNAMSVKKQEMIADKLLTTLFYAYPYSVLKNKLTTGSFLTTLRQGMQVETTDKAWLENHIIDDDIFRQSEWNAQEAINILTRFYAMQDLDSYYLKNWIAYILTQTIMFSPAYELESTHTPNIATVYNRLVVMLGEESGLRYMTYVHMMSEDNWRRFRSPEDNGREMLEIFTLDMNDSHVPIAATALQNWKLDSKSDTLVVGLNQNQDPLSLFNTTIYNGDDFYRELVKSDLFIYGVTQRLVAFFFPNSTGVKKNQISNTIVQSNPETWQDILLQIVFSQEYLLHSHRVKSAEELFFSTAKKTYFKHRGYTFHGFKNKLEKMHQATMKYKLGKLHRVPLDTLSFANYHQYIRESMLLQKSNPSKEDDYTAWSRHGWGEAYVANENFEFDENNAESSLVSFIYYLFNSQIHRDPSNAELTLFKNHMLYVDDDPIEFRYAFNMVRTYTNANNQLKQREKFKRNIAIIVLDYISRLTETYTLKEVQ